MAPGLAMTEGHGGVQWAEVNHRGLCALGTADPDLWFPVSASPVTARREAATALAICHECPVRRQCLELSLRHWDLGQHGIWGGTLPGERKEIRSLLLSSHTGDSLSLERSA